ncbi:ACP S-malonyltransferase, partial [Nonomuraea basaltis]
MSIPWPRLAFLFPGVGSQYPGMAAKWSRRYGTFRETLNEASDELGLDLAGLCEDPAAGDRLNRQVESQLALLAMGVALYRVFREEIGLPVTHLAGHSLGEYTALCCAGALPLAEAVRLVRLRGEAVSRAAEALDGGMMWVLDLDADRVERVCRHWTEDGFAVYPAIVDGPRQVAISARGTDLRRAAAEFEARGARVFPLRVSGPFHSPLMRPAAEELLEALAGVTIAETAVPVLSGVDARPHPGGAAGAALLADQLVRPVRWDGVQSRLLTDGVGAAVELGPGRVLSFIAARNGGRLRAWSVDDHADFDAVGAELHLGRDDASRVLDSCLRIAVSTPTRRHGPDIVRHFRLLEERRRTSLEIEPAGVEAAFACLGVLDDLLSAKGLDRAERRRSVAA